eukprot:6335396-Prymnesium_polylepis.1
MPVCRDARGWTNYLGLTCAEYVSRGWCSAGRAKRFVGAVFGNPEKSCCACGRLVDSATTRVTQIVFMAAHAITADDARIWRAYATELHEEASSHMWILLFRGTTARRPPSWPMLARWRSLRAF